MNAPTAPCGKQAYESERACKKAIHNRLNKGSGCGKLIAYRCELRECLTKGYWHMTSREPMPGQERKTRRWRNVEMEGE